MFKLGETLTTKTKGFKMNIDFTKQALQSLANYIDTFLSINVSDPFYWFYGGSFRFDYIHEGSDLDVFVYIKDKTETDIIHYFHQHGFRCVYDSTYEGTKSFGMKHCNLPIHLNVISNDKAYKEMYEEHENLEKFLYNHPILRDSARYLKVSGKMKGSEIYRYLLNMAKTKPKHPCFK